MNDDLLFDVPALQTERLTLRAPRWSDFEAYAAFRADPEQSKFVGGPYSRSQSFDHLAEIAGHWVLRGYGRFVVAERETDAPLGIVGPYYPEGWPEPEIAWSVFPSAQGKSIAYEAAFAARRYAYEVLDWETAISMIPAGNDRSVALAKRLGCSYEGDHHHPEIGDMTVWRHPSAEDLS